MKIFVTLRAFVVNSQQFTCPQSTRGFAAFFITQYEFAPAYAPVYNEAGQFERRIQV